MSSSEEEYDAPFDEIGRIEIQAYQFEPLKRELQSKSGDSDTEGDSTNSESDGESETESTDPVNEW